MKHVPQFTSASLDLITKIDREEEELNCLNSCGYSFWDVTVRSCKRSPFRCFDYGIPSKNCVVSRLFFTVSRNLNLKTHLSEEIALQATIFLAPPESPVSEKEINEFDDKMKREAATIRHRMRELIYFQEKIGKLQIDMYIRQDMLKKQEDEAKQRAENLAQAERNLEIREEELRKSLGADFSGFRCFGRLQTLVDPLLTLFKTTAITNKILQTSTETSVSKF
ncbi:hypothetical protein M0802_015137 [Mischocyttarus mexicanus]|nr:hypothetical protein M0802_015137 [Mischocyttarus mexicanus]